MSLPVVACLLYEFQQCHIAICPYYKNSHDHVAAEFLEKWIQTIMHVLRFSTDPGS